MVQKELIIKAYNETIDIATEIIFMKSKESIKYDDDFLSEEEFENVIYTEYISKLESKPHTLKHKAEIKEIKDIIHEETLLQYDASIELYKIEQKEKIENDSKNNKYLNFVLNNKITKHKTTKNELNEFEELLVEGIHPIIHDVEGERIFDIVLAIKEAHKPGSVYSVLSSKHSIDTSYILKTFSEDKVYDIERSLEYVFENPMRFQNTKIGPFKVVETEIKVDDEKKIVYNWENYLIKNNKPEAYFNLEYILNFIIDRYVKSSSKKAIDMPIIFTNDDKTPALAYFDKNKIVDGDFPNIRSFLTHLDADDEKVFNAFVYSIFEARNTSRQMMVLYDDGFSGKSVFLKALSSYLGNNISKSINNDDINGNFFFSKTYGKRFITVPDNNNPKITMTEKIKSITGGDPVTVEYKGMGGFRADAYGKIIIASNHKLTPQNATHQSSRLLIFKLKPYEEEILKTMCKLDEDGNIDKDHSGNPIFLGSSSFDDDMISEFPAYVSYCKKDYDELCKSHKNIIPSSNNMINFDEAVGLNSDEIYLNDVSKYFEPTDKVNTELIRVTEILKQYSKIKNIKELNIEVLFKELGIDTKRCRNTSLSKEFYNNLDNNNTKKAKGLLIRYDKLQNDFPGNYSMESFLNNANMNKFIEEFSEVKDAKTSYVDMIPKLSNEDAFEKMINKLDKDTTFKTEMLDDDGEWNDM